jgi:hypothetical protein
LGPILAPNGMANQAEKDLRQLWHPLCSSVLLWGGHLVPDRLHLLNLCRMRPDQRTAMQCHPPAQTWAEPLGVSSVWSPLCQGKSSSTYPGPWLQPPLPPPSSSAPSDRGGGAHGGSWSQSVSVAMGSGLWRQRTGSGGPSAAPFRGRGG